MNLTRNDYLALSAMLLTSIGLITGFVYLSIEASESSLKGKIDLVALEAQHDRDTMKASYADFTAEISEIVSTGLQNRTDEVVLAFTELSDVPGGLVIEILNMPVDGGVFERFTSLKTQLGTDVSLFQINGVAHATVSLDRIEDRQSYLIQSIFDGVDNAESEEIQVRFIKDSENILGTTALQRALLRKGIETLQIRLEKTND